MQVAFDFSGAGILAAIVLGVTTSTLWSKGWPKMLSSGVLPPFDEVLNCRGAQPAIRTSGPSLHADANISHASQAAIDLHSLPFFHV